MVSHSYCDTCDGRSRPFLDGGAQLDGQVLCCCPGYCQNTSTVAELQENGGDVFLQRDVFLWAESRDPRPRIHVRHQVLLPHSCGNVAREVPILARKSFTAL